MGSETKFLMYVTNKDRIRHFHFNVKGTITAFTVQYEALISGKWQAIIRYDNAHGFAHMDRIFPDGSEEKTPLPYWNINEVLTFAQSDLKSNWEVYRKRFENEIKNDY